MRGGRVRQAVAGGEQRGLERVEEREAVAAGVTRAEFRERAFEDGERPVAVVNRVRVGVFCIFTSLTLRG